MSLLVWALIWLGGLVLVSLAIAGLAFIAMFIWLLLVINDEDEINRS